MNPGPPLPAERLTRIEALLALKPLLEGSPHPSPAAPALHAAGELLRRAVVARVDPGRIDQVLRALPAEDLRQAIEAADVKQVREALGLATEEAVEAALAEEPDERELWAGSAFQALQARDGLESTARAIARWRDLGGTLDGRTGKALQRFTRELEELDRTLRGRARWLVALNPRRRLERDLLEPAFQETAWWYGDRAGCDDLVARLADPSLPPTEHLTRCTDCRRDLGLSRMVEKPPRRHLTPDDLWNYDLGLMPLGERKAAIAHADGCLACTQLLSAVDEGERAIAETAGRQVEANAPRLHGGPPATEGFASTRRSGRHLVAAQSEFRVVLVRDPRRARLLVQPLSSRGLAAAAVSLLPRRPLEPHPTAEGLEFELGENEALKGKVARVRIRVTAQSIPFERDVEL